MSSACASNAGVDKRNIWVTASSVAELLAPPGREKAPRRLKCMRLRPQICK
jgi:hypothetical protein